MLGLERQANHDIAAGAKILHGNIVIAGLDESLANLLQIGRLGVIDLDQRAAGEFDRKMEAAVEQKEHRQQEGEQRNDVEHQRVAHERNIFFDAKKFHLCSSLFGFCFGVGFGRSRGRVGAWLPDLADGQRFKLALTAVNQIDQRTRYDHGGEQ